MKQIITTTLTIAKPLRLALVLITLIFLPSTAWGYDNTNPTIISNFTGLVITKLLLMEEALANGRYMIMEMPN